MKIKNLLPALLIATAISNGVSAQTERVMTVDELLRITEENNPTLAVSRADIAVAKQQVEVAKNAMLPSVSAGLQGYYISDAVILDKDFSKVTDLKMPHFGNTLSVDASELLWKGGAVKNSIKIQSLREDISELSFENNKQSVKLSVLSYYLDLDKVMNQTEIYRQNIELAEQRLSNIEKFYKQGMVTRNDVIRGRLQLSNLKLAMEVAENNRAILNKQLINAMGLPEGTEIKPDPALTGSLPEAMLAEIYKENIENHPAVLMSKKAVDIQDVNKKIIKAERVPAVSAFGGNRLARPITSTSPAMDMYSNGWSGGLSLNWNIDNLYKTPKKIRQNELEREKALAQERELKDNLDVAISAAYIKYNEAISQKNSLEVNKNLAYENYRIMNSKYNNQLAILLDLIDASNAKLDAELQYANSEINVIYSYYKLLKESGKL